MYCLQIIRLNTSENFGDRDLLSSPFRLTEQIKFLTRLDGLNFFRLLTLYHILTLIMHLLYYIYTIYIVQLPEPRVVTHFYRVREVPE